MRLVLVIATCALLLAGCAAAPPRDTDEAPMLRIATYNGSLNTDIDGGLIARLRGGDEKARKIAAVIQTVRPDLLLLNEFDYDARGEAATLFLRDYLGKGQHGRQPIEYAHHYLAPVNTGVPSGLDIDRDGRLDGPADAWGFGRHPGQYGMLVLSRHPIEVENVRTFRDFKWRDMPGALAPPDPATGGPYYDAATWNLLRLSSKSHWDVPVATPLGIVHFLVSHPTPPVFDGPEDRNGRRNHDEIRIWADYLTPSRAGYLHDDLGRHGGLPESATFVLAGDLNSDAADGSGPPGAMAQLLEHPRVRASMPASEGAIESARDTGGVNPSQRGDPRHDTGGFGGQSGNLRVDYVLPSRDLDIVRSGVFWPRSTEPDAAIIDATDHHMVWIDVRRPRN